MNDAAKGRVVFLIRIKPRHAGAVPGGVRGNPAPRRRRVPGHLVDQVYEQPDDPASWLITSEWGRRSNTSSRGSEPRSIAT